MVLTEKHLCCLKIPCHLWDQGLNSKCGWEAQEFSCLQNIHTGSRAHPVSHSTSAMGFFTQQQRSQDVKFTPHLLLVKASWNVTAHTQKPDFVFRRNGQVHLNQRGCQFSRLLAAEVRASAVVMLYTPCSEVVWRVWLPTPFVSFPFTPLPCITMCHHISTGVYQNQVKLYFYLTACLHHAHKNFTLVSLSMP